MPVSDSKVSLLNIGNGAAVELFDAELLKVLEDIQDPNSAESAKRKVTLSVTLDPKDRDYAAVSIDCKASMAKTKPYGTNFFIGKAPDGRAEAFEHNPKQMKLEFESRQEMRVEAAHENVAQLAAAGDE